MPPRGLLGQIPNAITASRGLAGLVCAWLLVVPGANKAAFGVFFAAILTDLVDGWVARQLGVSSRFGEWLDGIADKILTDANWLGLWWVGWAPTWLVAPLLLRDVVVAAGWGLSWSRGLTWKPVMSGRIMVSFEGVALCVLLFHGPWLGIDWPAVGLVLGALTLLLSATSAAEYAWVGPKPG